MYFRCFSTIESLFPVQDVWTSAAFTVAMSCPLCREGARLARLPSDPLLALTELTHLVAAAAGVHVAPAPAVILGPVHEEPGAGVVRALSKELAIVVARQQVRRRARDRPQRAREVIGLGPSPLEPVGGALDAGVAHRVRGLGADEFDIFRRRPLRLRDVREGAPDGLTQGHAPAMYLRGLLGTALGFGEEPLRLGGRQKASLPRELDEVGVPLDVLVTGRFQRYADL